MLNVVGINNMKVLMIIALLLTSNVLMANHDLINEPKVMKGYYNCNNSRTNKTDITLDLKIYADGTMRYDMTKISNFSSLNELAWSMYHNDYTKKDYLVLRIKNNSGKQVEFNAEKQEIYLDNKAFTSIPLICKKLN